MLGRNCDWTAGFATLAIGKQDKFLLLFVVDFRGVYDALARSSSSCLGLKDKKSGLEALALKQSLVECGTMIRLVSFRGTAGRMLLQKTLTRHVLLGNCSFVVVFAGN